MENNKRPPLDLSTRMILAIEMLRPYPDRCWGRATQLAKTYGISTASLYKLGKKAEKALTIALKPTRPGPKPKAKTSIAATKRRRRLAIRRRKDLDRAKQAKNRRERRRDRRRRAFATMKQRRRIVHDYLARRRTLLESVAAAQTAERYGFGVSTIRRWAAAFSRQGKRGLLDKVRHSSARRTKLTSVVVGFIVLLRTRLGWGAQRIAAELKSQGIASISHQTVHRAFKKYQLKTKTYHPKGKSNGIGYKRYQKRAPNQLWHLDFAGPLSTIDGNVYLLVVVDDYSRFAIAIDVLDCQQTETVTAVLSRLFNQYGVPEEIMTDNGYAFTRVNNRESHPFFLFCLSHNITHQLIAPYYPESNGKAEAMVKTIKRECIRHFAVSAMGRHQLVEELSRFQNYYNWYRLHSSLSYDVPSAFYCGVRLESSLRAVPQLQGISLPMSPVPEPVPRIDIDFIHRHTALVAAFSHLM